MKLDQFLNRKSFIAFIIFLLAAIIAFWPGYFGRILSPVVDSHLHRHGIAMTLWCVMLIAQAVLIRNRQNTIHKWIGFGSYILVPLLAFSGFDLVNHLFHGAQQLGPGHFYFIALSVNAIFAFLILYGLAIYFRKNAKIHARYMAVTILPLVSPISDRIIYRFVRSLIPYAPKIGNMPIVPFYGFLIADLILIGLIIWDWRSNKRWDVFPVALGILLIYHFSVLYFYQYGFWQKFCYWFINLPLD